MKKTVKKGAKAPVKPIVNNREFVPTKAELEELTSWHLSRLDRAFDIGERLNHWKAKLAYGNWGEFTKKWIDPIMSQSAANRYMRLAANKSKLAKLTNLKTLTMGEALAAAEKSKKKGERRGATKEPKSNSSKKASLIAELEKMNEEDGNEDEGDLASALKQSVKGTPIAKGKVVPMSPIDYTRESYRKELETLSENYHKGKLPWAVMAMELKDLAFKLGKNGERKVS